MLHSYLADLKASLTASPIVENIDITDEFITSVSGFLECRIMMVDGSMLKFSEYFTIDEGGIRRNKYSFHLQKNSEFILRWDNAPHHKELSTHPFHVHRKNGVHDSKDMTIDDVLGELSEFISNHESKNLVFRLTVAKLTHNSSKFFQSSQYTPNHIFRPPSFPHNYADDRTRRRLFYTDSHEERGGDIIPHTL